MNVQMPAHSAPTIADPLALPALRFLTCGSVDDGKSTLIGRLLFEQNLILEDQLSSLTKDSLRHGTDGQTIDFALLVDGLEAERQQGITIDVAYRFFTTSHRSFIAIDTPGHEQYTRNMATGASNAQCAVLLVDARKGLLTQTFRHATIVALLGVTDVILAINKFDLVGYDRKVFNRIVAEFRAFAVRLKLTSLDAIPISARHGDNVSHISANTPWYKGKTLLDSLETIKIDNFASTVKMRFPVQWVNRPNLDFRGFSGTLASGTLHKGQTICVAANGQKAVVATILSANGESTKAEAGQALTLVLDREIDISRGDLLTDPRDRPDVADQFAANLIWFDEEKLVPGRSYVLKIGSRIIAASVTEIKYRLDIDSLEHHSTQIVRLNEIGFCNIATAQPIAFDPYEQNHATGAFILIDRINNRTVAAGMIAFAIRGATHIHSQDLLVTKNHRVKLKGHNPAILWFTGLSGAGKSTIANLVEAHLSKLGVHTVLLDGDNLRHGLNRDLGFTDADRIENIRRIGEVAKLMNDAGLMVLCSFISPFQADRAMVRELVPAEEFIEIFVDTALYDCIKRDPKGLYRKALAGEIKNFTGIDQPYQPPLNPEIHLKSEGQTAELLAKKVINHLIERNYIEGDSYLVSI